GTLAAMTEVTVKVLPKAQTEATAIVSGLDDARAAQAMAAAMGSPCDVSAAAHLPDHVASWFDGLPKPEATTALRIEGFTHSVAHRKDALAAAMKPFGGAAILGEESSRALWRSVREIKPFAANGAAARPLWRISTAPMKGAAIAAQITPAAQMFYDWGGGLIWVAMPFADEPDAAAIRRAVAMVGGHATLIRAPASVRASVDVFEPQEPGIAALSKRVKESFDPKGVLNPGRLWAGV
ncbi:MAG: FAD-linked oxidase C-terminal domain-containing protein, partial [Pseudolabrys sp.]